MRDTPRLDAVDLAVAEAANIAVSPDQVEAPDGAGFLGRLLGRDAPAISATVTSDVVDLPAAEPIPEQAAVELAALEASAAIASSAGPEVAAAQPERQGLLGGLFTGRRAKAEAETEAAETPLPIVDTAGAVSAALDDAPVEGAPLAETAGDVEPIAVSAPAAPESEDLPPETRRGGLFGLFGGGQRAAVAEVEAPELLDPQKAEEIAGAAAEVTLVAAAPAPPSEEIAPAAAPEAESAERRGLLGGLFNARANEAPPVPTGPDRIRIPDGMMVPYGRVGTNCEVPRASLGKRIVRQSGFEIWDSDPRSTAPRNHYVTGFADGCARQFTGALVMVGDVGTHEIVRYSNVNIDQPWSEVDNAYERLKTDFCGTRRARPCGARLEALGDLTAFITVYETFGSGPEWVEILLHDGEVLAMTQEGI